MNATSLSNSPSANIEICSGCVLALPVRGSRGFSLVELVLAIGIVSFAFMAILGMLPVSLATFNKSINATVESQIAQRLQSAAAQTPFANINNIASDSYYDDEGFPATASDFIYHARLTVPAPLVTVGGASGGVVQPRVKKLELQIAKNRTVDAAASSSPRDVRTITFYVADMGL